MFLFSPFLGNRAWPPFVYQRMKWHTLCTPFFSGQSIKAMRTMPFLRFVQEKSKAGAQEASLS